MTETWRQRCLFFFVVSAARVHTVTFRAASLRSSFKSRMPECQSGDAGAIPADRTNFQNTQAGANCAAKSPKLCLLGAAPRRRANFNNCGVAKWEGSGLISRSRAGSIPASATDMSLGSAGSVPARCLRL